MNTAESSIHSPVALDPYVHSDRTNRSALIRNLEDGDLPIDNDHIENRIRPVALGKANWLFAGSLRAGQRAAAIMSLIQSAKRDAAR